MPPVTTRSLPDAMSGPMSANALVPHAAPMPAQPSEREAAMEICASVGATMEALLQLIEAESVLLRAGKPIAAAAVAARKNEFAAAYLVDLDMLREVGSDLAFFAPEAVDRLRRLHEEFVSLLQIDMATLLTAQAAAETPRRAPQRQGTARPAPRLERVTRLEARRLVAGGR